MKQFLASVWDPGFWRPGYLAAFLGRAPRLAWLMPKRGADVAWIGWGCQRSGRRARRLAARTGTTCLLLEDGFLRSVGLGKDEPPLSIVLDDVGIYYDAHRASRLEALVARSLTPAETARAQELRRAWCAGRVSKYNHQRDAVEALPASYVLAVDQTRGDASIRFGQADARSFARMLEAALHENPQAEVLLKVHPEVLAGRKRGHFDLDALAREPRVRVVGTDTHPAGLIERAARVYTVTSQMGFEALLWGKPVRTFGMPFYGGWGLTEDELPAPPRRARAPLEQLVHAALVDYPRYVDPETGAPCEVERVLEHLSLQRRMRERFPRVVYAHGFSPWKRPIISDFCGGSAVRFVENAGVVPADSTLLVWGRKPSVGTPGPTVTTVRVEDGFMRSVGLGADLIRPLSWVMDQRGIYYDARVASDLEHLLEHGEFAPPLLQRARALRERIVATGLTKYNVGARSWKRPAQAKRVVLVPGQVEADASIAFGTDTVRTNMALLQAVRAENPAAYVVYKPHPDVLAGLRAEGADERKALQWCDEIVTDVGMGRLLDAVDEVHVLTSLAGFEALLRGKPVTTYGMPFYCGWGLTRDLAPLARRTRRLTLDELVAATLLIYPVYVSRTTGFFTTAERALDELLSWREMGGGVRLPWWRQPLRLMLRVAKFNP